MNLNWLGVISSILAFAAFFVAYQFTKDKSIKVRMSYFVLALIASVPGASYALYYTHTLPELSWYYQFRSIMGTEFLIVFLGVAGGLVATLLPRVFLILPLLGVAAFSIAPVIKPFIGPISTDEMRDDWDGDICLQSTPSTCGAASSATILKYLDVDASESELAIEAHSYSGGTEAWYLARAIRARGFDVDFEFSTGFSPEGGLPAVVGVRLESFGHFIAVIGMQGDRFIVGDPLRGRELLSSEELQKRYVFTGFHMRIKK